MDANVCEFLRRVCQTRAIDVVVKRLQACGRQSADLTVSV